MQKKKKNTLLEKLSTRFHILLVNEKTLEKKKLISSSTSSILITAVFVFGLMLATSFLVIYFTPLKEYFRGYTSVELRESSVENALKLYSLEMLYITQTRYWRKISTMHLIYQDKDLQQFYFPQ